MTRPTLCDAAACEVGESRLESHGDPCRCRDCGPSPFEMRVAARRRALDAEGRAA